MAFRDHSEALRARIGALEVELDDAQDRVDELEADHVELEPLRARLKDLEEELGKRDDRHGKAKRPPFVRLGMIAAVAAAVAVGGILYESLAGGPELRGEPIRGTMDLAADPLPSALTAEVFGEHELGRLAGGCQGYVPTRPLVVLHTAEPTRVHLWTESNADLVLFLSAESGLVFCDDDSGDRTNPMLVVDLPAGNHRVWVGTYSEGERARFDLRIDARNIDGSGLSVDATPTVGALAMDGESHFVTRGEALGTIGATRARAGCPGNVPAAPQVTLDLDEAGRATIIARATRDLVLLMRRPDGSFVCDDDGAGSLDPMLEGDLSPGRHAIWVGTYAAGASSPFELTIDVAPIREPDANAAPRLGRWDLDAESLLSFSERVVGRTAVSSTHPECRTLYGSRQADVELTLDHARTVTLSLTSDSWLGLLVEHPDGTQSCDPSLDNGPQRWDAGVHQVWIAAPEPGAGTRFTLVAQTQD